MNSLQEEVKELKEQTSAVGSSSEEFEERSGHTRRLQNVWPQRQAGRLKHHRLKV